jgi:hypothetical protein
MFQVARGVARRAPVCYGEVNKPGLRSDPGSAEPQ